MQLHVLPFGLWIATELVLVLRRRSRAASARDRGSMRVLWIAITLGCALAIGASFDARWRLPGDAHAWYAAGLACTTAGLVVRWWAVLVLGRFFTVDVAIRADHELVTRGPYRFVRHPSYSGLLLVLAGLGCVVNSALSLAILAVATMPALAWRISIEERALAETFGPRWDEYARRTRRIVPFVI